MPNANRKVKGTIHWVSTAHALPVELRMYDRLFMVEDPASADAEDLAELINPDSEQIIPVAYAEDWLRDVQPEQHFQFVRKGYFTVDKDSTPDKMVFNQTVGLRDAWAKKNASKK